MNHKPAFDRIAQHLRRSVFGLLTGLIFSTSGSAQIPVENSPESTAAASDSAASATVTGFFGKQQRVQPFVAQFDVSLNGKYIGEAQMQLLQTDTDTYEVRLSSKATKGMAGFAGAKSRELARFSVENGQARSLYYEQEEKLLFDKDNWNADFDWQDHILRVDDEGDEWTQALEGSELDSLSVYLLLADAAAKRRPWLVTKIVTSKSVEGYSYQILENEQLDTACGNIETRVYQGILPDSYKKVWTWHAAETDWLPVRVRKTRKRGDILQLDLRALESVQAPEINCGVIERS